MYAKSMTAAFAAMLFSAANAHFLISSPAPIPGSNPKDPLDPSGSNFPCHGADLSQGTVTELQVGQTYPLKFELGGGANTATHGGGSCQLSVTYETDAAKLKDPASWKVIKSYIGGCPTNAKGNLPSAVMCPGGAPDCVNNLDFTVPPEVQDGNAIFSWTWSNNIGNREQYQNCAKVKISGGQNQLDSLPPLFVANLASINQCATSEGFNTDFPNPGKYVEKAATLNYPLKAPTGNGCGSGSGSGSGSSGSSGSGSGPSAAAPKSSAAPSNPGGVFAPGASSAAASPTTMATSAKAPAATPAAPTGGASPAESGPSTSSTGSTGACVNGAVPCTAEGFYCVDAQHYGECAFGCAVPMAMAEGTQCTNNAVSAMVKPNKRFHARHLQAHVHKRHIGDSF
jgi:hypothetical protein